jgi:hypothetical protein
MLSGPDMEKLEGFQQVKIRQLQNLPEQCANIAVLGLSGILAVEGEINKWALNLFRNIAAKEDDIEHLIATHQLAVKDHK